VDIISQKTQSITINYEQISRMESLAPLAAPADVKKYHIIFLNDTSGSMASVDTKPSLSWIPHKNRVGALYEACHVFLRERQAYDDIVSFIGYDSVAKLEFSKTPLKSNADEIVQKMITRPADGGTSFLEPIKKLDQVLGSNPADTTPIAFFMTDGMCDDGGASAELTRIMQKYAYSGFVLHTVMITNNAQQPLDILQLLATAGKGKSFLSAINLQDMKKTYSTLVALLE